VVKKFDLKVFDREGGERGKSREEWAKRIRGNKSKDNAPSFLDWKPRGSKKEKNTEHGHFLSGGTGRKNRVGSGKLPIKSEW